MHLSWLNKNNNAEVVVFFNGWGMDDNVVSHLDCGNYDVLTVNDYNVLSELPDLSEYNVCNVVAWSMGVMVATLFDINAKSATAINGTLYPIHLEYGINPKAYKLMELGFGEETKDKFYHKMFDVVPEEFVLPDRDVISQKTELTALKSYIPNEKYKFTRVIVGNNDKIIPTSSQLNYWKDAEVISGGHCLFYNFKKWEELL